MTALRDGWCFGPRTVLDPEERAFFDRHAPVVRAWIEGGVASGTMLRVDEAEHAAFCLVDYRVLDREGGAPRWEGFDVERFLWDHLPCAGIVELYEPRRFFQRVVEIIERFGEAGLIDDPSWRTWLGRLRELEEDFVRFYGEAPAEGGPAS